MAVLGPGRTGRAGRLRQEGHQRWTRATRPCEGRPDANTRLLAWVDTPDSVTIYTDLGTPGPSPDPDLETDTVLTVLPNYNVGPGLIHTLLLDGTAASGFQFFRRADNGGLQAITDYTIPSRR